jgi:pyruvate/2-oxoacid:ferredoxin oxidoreductase alpha subunit
MAVGFFGKQMLKNLVKGGKQKTTGTEVVNPFKFKPSKSKLEKAVKKLEIDTAQQKGRTKKIIQKMEQSIEPARTNLRQTTQKLSGEPVTKSGFSKGKDIKKKEKK